MKRLSLFERFACKCDIMIDYDWLAADHNGNIINFVSMFSRVRVRVGVFVVNISEL